MRKGQIHIGTSGWSYKDWKEIFYPKTMKSTDWLSYYAESFDTTEINTSFYHLPKEKTVLGWVEKVPANFKFCPKISRYLTHMKKLHEPEEPLEHFFDVFDLIKEHLGPILIQLPPSLKFNAEIAKHFFSLLRKKYSDYDFVLEVRHNSWLEQEAIDLISKYKIGFVLSQSGVGFPFSEIITSDIIYVRFHGPGKLYASSYPNEVLDDFAAKFKNWEKNRYQIWAFFNNDFYGYAIDNARTLSDLIADKG